MAKTHKIILNVIKLADKSSYDVNKVIESISWFVK
jgi:hypothetical protein